MEEYKYSISNLDIWVNDEETLIEYIQNGYKEFYEKDITREILEAMSDKELNELIEELDYLFTK